MSERYHLWMIISDKLGKDERLHFVFGDIDDLVVFTKHWMIHSENRSFHIVVEVTKK